MKICADALFHIGKTFRGTRMPVYQKRIVKYGQCMVGRNIFDPANKWIGPDQAIYVHYLPVNFRIYFFFPGKSYGFFADPVNGIGTHAVEGNKPSIKNRIISDAAAWHCLFQRLCAAILSVNTFPADLFIEPYRIVVGTLNHFVDKGLNHFYDQKIPGHGKGFV